MLDEAARIRASVLSRLPPEKLVAIALVVLLHLLLIWLLLRATVFQVQVPPVFREQPITLWLKPAAKPKPPQPKPEEKEKKQGPAPVTRAIGTPLPAPSGTPPASDYNGNRALGRYLNNCSNLAYGNLSQRDLAHCLGNQWDNTDSAGLRLGNQPSSPWKAQMEKRRKPARKVEHECAQDTPNSNLGLPCFSFAN